jgi:hypothetical protein
VEGFTLKNDKKKEIRRGAGGADEGIIGLLDYWMAGWLDGWIGAVKFTNGDL